jgi:ABC-2 type transport system permease protein
VSDTAPVAARPPLTLVVESLLHADFAVLVRSGRTLILNIALPIIILVITTTGKNKLSLNSASFDIGMALTYGLLSSSLIGYATAVAQDRQAGVFQRLRVTPAPTWTIMASRLLVQVLVNLVMAVIVVTVGCLIHGIAYGVGTYLLIAAVSLVGGAMFLSLGQAVVGLVNSAAAVAAVGRILYIGLILLGILGATGLLGDTLKTIADWSPVGAMINLFSAATNLSAWAGTDTTALIASAGYIAIGMFVGIRWFRWETH